MNTQLLRTAVLSCAVIASVASLTFSQVRPQQRRKAGSPEKVVYHTPDPPFVELPNPTEKFEQRWSGSYWIDEGHWVWSYDEAGREIEYSHVDLWRRTTTYDGAGRVEQVVTEQYGHETDRKLFVYDDAGNLLEEIGQTAIGSEWENNWRTVNTYEDLEQPSVQTHQTWTEGGWEEDSQRLNSYDASGNRIEEIWQDWTGASWAPTSRSVCSYDDSGNQTSCVYQDWGQSDWQNGSRWAWNYDDHGNMIEEVCNQQWTGTEWESWGRRFWGCSGRKVFTYDLTGDPIAASDEAWSGSEWLAEHRQTFLYDDLGRLVAWTWDNETRYRYVYETPAAVSYPTIVPPGWMLDWTFIDAELQRVIFTDANTGITLGYKDGLLTILRTIDGGLTWMREPTSIDLHLGDIYFVDSSTGTIVGGDGAILRTTDGGVNWTSQASGTTAGLNGVFFTDSLTGTIVGGEGTILRTTDAGVNWTRQSSGSNASLSDVFFIDASTGFTVGWGGTILRTDDGGDNWIGQYTDSTVYLDLVLFTDANAGMIFGYDGEQNRDIILRTADGGVTWTREYPDFGDPERGLGGFLGYGMHFTDAMLGMGVGGNYWCHCMEGAIARTTDGGTVWEWAQFWDVGFRDVHIVDANTAVAVGWTGDHRGQARRGAILRITFGTATGIEHDAPLDDSIPRGFALHQNYPNPFNPTTTITYALPEGAEVRLTMYNALGQVVEQHAAVYRPPGVYSLLFDAVDLPSGVYFYRLEAGDLIDTRSMILAK